MLIDRRTDWYGFLIAFTIYNLIDLNYSASEKQGLNFAVAQNHLA